MAAPLPEGIAELPTWAQSVIGALVLIAGALGGKNFFRIKIERRQALREEQAADINEQARVGILDQLRAENKRLSELCSEAHQRADTAFLRALSAESKANALELQLERSQDDLVGAQRELTNAQDVIRQFHGGGDG